MGKILRKALYQLIDIFKNIPTKYVLFESLPDYTDNTYAVFKYMKEYSLFGKYKPIWIDKKMLESKGGSFKFKYYINRSKVIVFCNKTFEKVRENQITVYLCHGSKSKKTRGKYEAPKDLDYILVQADIFKDSLKYEYNLSDTTKMLTMGYPRNDDLLVDNNIDREKLFGTDFKKLIVWYPTFRQHQNKLVNVSNITLPIVHNEEFARKLNEYAKSKEVLIVIKPHFAQDVSFIKDNGFSNILLIDDNFLKEKNIRSYQLLNLTDALLTDYSSVYYDYLLTDKPIGLVWEDYDEYKKNQGFAMDPDFIYSGGEKIYNIDDFCEFLDRISKNKDILKQERNKIKDITNVYQDSLSSKRVSEFVAELLKK